MTQLEGVAAVQQTSSATVDAYYSLARFADAQYRAIAQHMKSAAYEAKQALIRQARRDAEKLKQCNETTRSYARLFVVLLIVAFLTLYENKLWVSGLV